MGRAYAQALPRHTEASANGHVALPHAGASAADGRDHPCVALEMVAHVHGEDQVHRLCGVVRFVELVLVLLLRGPHPVLDSTRDVLMVQTASTIRPTEKRCQVCVRSLWKGALNSTCVFALVDRWQLVLSKRFSPLENKVPP
eukprot:135699-Prorocentrum_minimum.AAC.2